MRPAIYRIDPLAGEGCLLQCPAQRGEGFVGTVDTDYDVTLTNVRVNAGFGGL